MGRIQEVREEIQKKKEEKTRERGGRIVKEEGRGRLRRMKKRSRRIGEEVEKARRGGGSKVGGEK